MQRRLDTTWEWIKLHKLLAIIVVSVVVTSMVLVALALAIALPVALIKGDVPCDQPRMRVLEVLQPQVCLIQRSVDIDVYGRGFLKNNDEGEKPKFSWNGNRAKLIKLADCSSLDVYNRDVEVCNRATVRLPMDFTDGSLLSVRNAEPCDGYKAESVEWVAGNDFCNNDTLALEDVSPSDLCLTTSSANVTVFGSFLRFLPGAMLPEFSFNGQVVPLQSLHNCTHMGLYDCDLEVCAMAVVTLPQQTATNATLSVRNTVPPCGDSHPPVSSDELLVVNETPLFIFFVDPDVVYTNSSSAGTEITIFASGYGADGPDALYIEHQTTGQRVVLEFEIEDPARPTKITAVVPSRLPEGLWDVYAEKGAFCPGALLGGLRTVVSSTMDVTAVDPAYVYVGEDTAVFIRGTGNPPFLAVPRVSAAAPDGTVANLRAVELVDGSTLTAVIPAGLSLGSYDLVVINPDANLGLLPNAFTVLDSPPPRVSAIIPASLDAAGDTADVLGESFQENITSSLECKLGITGSSTFYDAVTDFVSSTRLSITVPSIPQASICLVTVTNTDGSFARFSAISIKNSAQKLNPPVAGPSLLHQRTGLSVVVGQATGTSRFLYAIGGMDGPSGDRLASIEYAAIDSFGGVSAWREARSVLPEPISHAKAVSIGNFIYLYGGSNNETALTSVHQANVLDPLATPDLEVDLSIVVDDGNSPLVDGTFYYRVSALFADDDPINPSGESLPGEIFTVRLPALNTNRQVRLVVELEWESVPDAVGYRLYRTRNADENPATDLGLLAETSETFYSDDGFVTPDTTTQPLRRGSLGNWRKLEAHPLGVARDSHTGAAITVPPEDDPLKYYIFAFGGRDHNNTALATYEFVEALITPPSAPRQRQVVTLSESSWTTGTSDYSGSPRYAMDMGVLTARDTTFLEIGRVQFYLGDGLGASIGSAFETNPTSTNGVPADGQMGTFAAVRQGRANHGYCMLAANNRLFNIGGEAFGTEAGAGELTNLGTLQSFSNQGEFSMSVERMYAGCATNAVFIYVVGGQWGTAAHASMDLAWK